MDLAAWLATYGAFHAFASSYEWDYDAVIPSFQPVELAARLVEGAAQTGRQAALALHALTYGVWWLGQVCADGSNAQPRAPNGERWLEAFCDAVLAEPAFIARSALSYVPPVPLGAQHYLDRRADAYLAAHRAPALDKVEDLTIEISPDAEPPPVDRERIWWALDGGSLGTASRLVRAAEIVSFFPRNRDRRPAVLELRRELVDSARDALIAGVPFWAKAWLVEHVALVDRALLADLVVHEQEPWLADQMRFELDLPIAVRHERWGSWLA